MFKEIGDSRNALAYFQRALDTDQSGKYLQGYSYRAFQFYAMGNIEKAIDDINMAISLKKGDEPLQHHLGIWQMGMGRYAIACDIFDKILRTNPESLAIYNREILLYYWHHLDKDLSDWCIDVEMAPYIKEGGSTIVTYLTYTSYIMYVCTIYRKKTKKQCIFDFFPSFNSLFSSLLFLPFFLSFFLSFFLCLFLFV